MVKCIGFLSVVAAVVDLVRVLRFSAVCVGSADLLREPRWRGVGAVSAIGRVASGFGVVVLGGRPLLRLETVSVGVGGDSEDSSVRGGVELAWRRRPLAGFVLSVF